MCVNVKNIQETVSNG